MIPTPEYTIDTDAIRKALNRLADEISFYPEMKMILSQMMKRADKKFIEQGPGWAAHAPATRRSREYAQRRGRMAAGVGVEDKLQLTLALRHSVTRPNDANSLAESDAYTAHLGSNLDYALLQNEGGTINVKGHNITIPSRPFLVIEDDDKYDYAKIILKGIERRINASGLGVG